MTEEELEVFVTNYIERNLTEADNDNSKLENSIQVKEQKAL